MTNLIKSMKNKALTISIIALTLVSLAVFIRIILSYHKGGSSMNDIVYSASFLCAMVIVLIAVLNGKRKK